MDRDEHRNRNTPRGNGNPGDFRAPPPREPDDIARDSQGRPIVDRFGRPVRNRPGKPAAAPKTPGSSTASRRSSRRPSRRTQRPRYDGAPGRAAGAGAAADGAQSTRFDLGGTGKPEPPQPERPRQYFPPQQPAQQQQPQPSQYVAPPPQQPSRYRPGTAIPPRRSGPRPPRQARRRRKSGCLRPILGVLAIFVVVTLVLTLWADAQLNRVEATPENQISDTAGTNWLLVGSDSRQGLSEDEMAELGTGGDIGVGRTDTIMLLHIPITGEATLISLPRDSYVEVPGFGMDKLNAAFTYGGPQLLSQTVEGATGLQVDHYAEIGMGGLANLVDSVGGIEMCVNEPINDPLANLDVQAGCQEFDGATALGYVRTRATAAGDLDRVERQREFFAALLDTVTSPGTLFNPIRMISLIMDTTSTFTVGNGDHVWHLARMAMAMRSGVQTETVPFAGFADYNVGNVVLWDEAGAEALFSSMR